MKKFIYVFSNEDKRKLLEAGYLLLKEDSQNEIYIFNAPNELSFALNAIGDYMESNTLTF